MKKIVTSFALDRLHINKLHEIAAELGVSKSEIIRCLVSSAESTDLQKQEPLRMTNSVLLSKVNHTVEKFFNDAMKLPEDQWVLVKAQAGEILKSRASVMYNLDTPETAVLKASYNPDETTKILYQLAGMSSADQFTNFKHHVKSFGNALS